MITRLANAATALVAAVINLLVVFDTVNWGEEEIAAVNLVAGLIISIVFGAQRQLQS